MSEAYQLVAFAPLIGILALLIHGRRRGRA